MSAYVEKRFSKGFILNEERLRKLHDIIKKRIAENNDIKFKVYRADSLVYDTARIEDIISEENFKLNKIEKVEITKGNIKDGNNHFLLTFCSRGGVFLSIKGDDRDNVFLLSSDITSYLNEDVNCCFDYDSSKLKIIFSIILLGSLAGVMYLTISSMPVDGTIQNKEEINKVLLSSDLNCKLNFMLKDRLSFDVIGSFKKLKWMLYIMICYPILMLYERVYFVRTLEFIFPKNLFLWGKEVYRYEKTCKWRTNIFWGIIMALIIGVLGSVIANKINF